MYFKATGSNNVPLQLKTFAPQLWDALVTTAMEVQQLTTKAIFQHSTVRIAQPLATSVRTDSSCWLVQPSGQGGPKFLLMLVVLLQNSSAARVEIRLPPELSLNQSHGRLGDRPVEVLFEQRRLTTNQTLGGFSDAFAAWGVHVYRLLLQPAEAAAVL